MTDDSSLICTRIVLDGKLVPGLHGSWSKIYELAERYLIPSHVGSLRAGKEIQTT